VTAANEDEDGNEVDPDTPDEPVVIVDDPRASLTSSTKVTWVAALVLLIASLAVLGVDRAVAAPGAAEQRQEMMEVAEAFTLALTNYDYRDLATTRQQVLDLSVRGFEQEFDRLLGGSGVQQALSDNQAVATATIAVGPLVADFGDHEARTFTVVEQTASGAGAAPTQQRLRVEVLLVETPDGWIVTGAEVS
jgi:hypothetical protein